MRGLTLLLSPERHRINLNKPNQQLQIRFRWQISGKKLLFVEEYLTSFLLLDPQAKNMPKKIRTSLVYLEKKCLVFPTMDDLGRGTSAGQLLIL